MKKNLIIIVVMVSLLLACTLTACTKTCAGGHTLVDVEVRREPTCDVVGEKVQKCSVCNATIVSPIPALGHAYGEWSANEDGSTHSRVCATDPSHIQTANHVDSDSNNICDDCSAEIVLINPDTCQHEWTDWTYNGNGTHTGVCSKGCGTRNVSQNCSGGNPTCTEPGVCAVCGGAYIPATNVHVYVGVVTTPAGCETVGEMTYTCQCGDSYTEEIPETGHSYGEWSYNNDGTHTRVCANDADHVETDSCSGGTATCTDAGLCEECGGAYIPATGHKYAENWTDNGENHIKVCENDSTHVISENHTYVETDRKDANCDNGEVITMTCQCGNVVMLDGDSAIGHNVAEQYVVENGVLYWTEICTNGFDCSHVDIKNEVTGVAEVSNAEDLKTVLENGYSAKLTADIEISESIIISSGDVSLDLNGYDVVNNGLQQSTVPGTMSCSVFVVSGEATEFTITGEGNVVACPDEELLESLPEDIEIVVSTITAIENTSISINGGSFEGGIVTDGSADIEIVDGTFIGFNPGDVLGSGMHSIYDAETDTYIVEEHNYVASEPVAPTCTEDGYVVYTCVCGSSYKVTTEEAPGHAIVIDEAVAPTCTETGLTEGSHCSVCSTVLVAQEDVPATGHTTVTDEAVAPTCTETGLTEGSHCSVCDTVLVEQEVVPATDHDYPETWTNNGENHIKRCGNDASHILTEEHNFVEIGRTPANCENAEVITYTCICGSEKTENGENALGHTIVKEYVLEDSVLYWTEVCTNECECNHNDIKREAYNMDNAYTANDLKMLLENGHSATLMNNIILTEGAISITDGEVTLDLNGYDITSTGVVQSTNVLGDTLYVCDVFVVSGYNTTFTITGSGTVSANPSEEALEGVNEDNLSVCVLSALNGAYVKIDGGGVYHSTGCTVIYARTESRVDIFDGGFIADEDWYGTYYTLDVWEGEHSDLSSARINVYGGIFVEFNPANHSNDGGYTSKVVEGYAHVVEIEEEGYGTIYIVEEHDGNNENNTWGKSYCSVCGICFSYRFHFVDGDKVYLYDDSSKYDEIGNGLILTLEAVEGEDDVFYVYENYSESYLVYVNETIGTVLSKDKTSNAMWNVYGHITQYDDYYLYIKGVGFQYEVLCETGFYFLSYCKDHNLVLTDVYATCTTSGGTAFACECCGLSDIYDYSPATGHNYDSVVTEPRCCGGEGYTTYTCKNEGCEYSYKDNFVDPLECVLSWKDNGDGTCTERCYLPCTKESCNGEVINGPVAHIDLDSNYVCDNCGAHVHKYTTSVVKATCEEGGYTLHTCDGCNDSYITDEIIALDHDFSEPVSNCDGTHTSTCSRGDCKETFTEKHSISQDDSIYCVCGMIMVEKAYSVEIGDVIVLVHMDGDTLKTMDIDFTASSTSALYLRVSDSAHQESYLLMTESGECLMRKSETGGRLSLESKITDEYRANWIISIAEDGAVSMRTVYNGFLGVDEYGIFCFNYPTDDSGSNGLVYYIYKLKDADSFDHTWSKYIPNGDGLTHTRTCSTCGLQETNDHNYVVIGGTDAKCESAGTLVYACECKSTFIEEDEDKPKLGHDWSDWSRGDATNAQHSRECSRCSKTETEVCSIDENQRIGYMVSDGVNGKLIAAQYICTICNQPANKVCDEEIIPVANEAELRAAISAGRSVIFENDIHVTSTIDIDCELTGDITLDLDSWELSSYNCALFNIYDSDGQSQSQVTIKNGFAVQTDAENRYVCCPIAIVNNEVKLIIESGEFENLANNELFVVRNHAELWINGGTFTVAYNGFSGVNDAFCSKHNGVIDLIDETGVDYEGSAYCSQAEFYGWEYDRDEDDTGRLIILDGSHAIAGYYQGDYVVEYCQYNAVVTEPGCCHANGYTTYTCKVCGDSYIDDYTDPIDCEWSWKDNGDGTCTNACYLRCSRENGCNAPIDGPISHKDINNDYVCDNCGAHIHKYVVTESYEPDCICDGYTVYTCDCGDSYITRTPPVACEFVWIDQGNGKCLYTCRYNCGKGSDFGEAHVDENDDMICDHCAGHVHKYVGVVTEPTCLEDGYVDYDCEGCGDWYYEEGPERLGHDFTKYVDNEDGTHTLCCSRERCKAVNGEPEEHVDTDSNKQCDSCGAEIVPKMVETELTLSFADVANRNSLTTEQQVWSQNGVTLINDRNEAQSPVADYAGPARFYKGSKITVECAGMQKIVINCNSTSYATALSDSFNIEGCQAEFDGKVITITFDNAIDSFEFTVGAATRFDSIVVTALQCEEHSDADSDRICDYCGAVIPCDHNYVGEVTDPTCTEKGYTTYTCSICGDEYKDHELDAIGHAWDWTYVDENTCSAVCLNDDSHTTSGAHVDSNPEDGNCDNCGESVTVTEPEKQEVELKLDFSDTANRISWSTTQQVWKQNGVTLTNNKGDSTSNIADYSKPARFYKSSEVTIDCKGMKEIVFDCNSSAYAKSLATSLSAAGYTATVSSDKVTLTLTEEKDSITFKLTDGQVRMDSLTVTAMQQCKSTSFRGVNLIPTGACPWVEVCLRSTT